MAKRTRSIPGSVGNPFGPDDLKELEEAERKLHDILPIIDKSEACGVECEAFREVHTALKEKITALKREFFSQV